MKVAQIGSQSEYLELVEICYKANRLELLPILFPAARDKIKLLVVEPRHLVSPDTLKVCRSIIIILCDHSKEFSGPCGWSQARTLTGWSEAILLQCTRGFKNDYEWIAQKAIEGSRTLIIEAKLEHLAAWTDFLNLHRNKQCPLLTALPADGSAARRPFTSRVRKARAR